MDYISIQKQGLITILQFNRPEKKNAITSGMYAILADTMQEATEDRGVSCLLFTGWADFFTSGNDIADFLNRPESRENMPVKRFLQQLAIFPKPMLASVTGLAVGVGTTLLFHCDWVVAGDNATFAMPFINLGLCPEAASTLLAPQIIGHHFAAEAMFWGEPMSASWAHHCGLVNRVVPSAEADELALKMAKKLTEKSPEALMETKRLLKASQRELVLARMLEEGEVFERLLKTDSSRAIFANFLNKKTVV
ncbi:MAG: enoyl-CoA hydratase [Gammaproteobacteria bacterium]|nr:enoyl-CoA hydratase [Gammaproteobacteria bacterium]